MSPAAPASDDPSRRIHSLTAELLNVYEELSLLYAVTAEMGRLTSEEAIAAAALTQATEIIPADVAWVVSWRAGAAATSARIGQEMADGDLETIARDVLSPLRDRWRSHVLINDIGSGLRYRLLACSLSSGRVPESYLCLLRSPSKPMFTTVDQKLIAAISSVAAIGIENVRLHRSETERARMQHELEMARTIQQSLLPRDFMCRTFLEAAGESDACQQIGGDYYDLVPVNDDDCLCIIADVSGKGPAAALKAALLQGNVQALSRTTVDLPTFMLTLNECFRARAAEACRFVTAFAGVLDRSGLLRYCNAGHNAPLVVRRNGQVVELTEGGPLLGFFERPPFAEGHIELMPGDILVLYTDGVTDCEDEQGQFFGSERLTDWAVSHAGCEPDFLRQELLRTIRSFSGNRAQPDDLTFLMLRYKGDA